MQTQWKHGQTTVEGGGREGERGREESRKGGKEGMRGGSEGGILASQRNAIHLKPNTDLEYRVGSALTTSFFNILQSLMIFRAPITFICRASLLERKERRRDAHSSYMYYTHSMYIYHTSNSR